MVSHIDVVIRIAVAFLLGASLGFERQWRQRTAGLQTNTLVSVGAALFVIVEQLNTDDTGNQHRIAAQVVSGIGFLAAGVILRDGPSVSGLNTAATIWCAAAIGVMSGSGNLFYATVGATVILTAHLTLRPLGGLLDRYPRREHLPKRRNAPEIDE